MVIEHAEEWVDTARSALSKGCILHIILYPQEQALDDPGFELGIGENINI